MKIYLDSDFCCHLKNDGSMTAIETSSFDGKCESYIEACRFIPSGSTWEDPVSGVLYLGESLMPIEDYAILEKAQSQYKSDETKYLGDIYIPLEEQMRATRNYPIGSFISIMGVLYEVIAAIPNDGDIILSQNVIKTTMDHYLETLKDSQD